MQPARVSEAGTRDARAPEHSSRICIVMAAREATHNAANWPAVSPNRFSKNNRTADQPAHQRTPPPLFPFRSRVAVSKHTAGCNTVMRQTHTRIYCTMVLPILWYWWLPSPLCSRQRGPANFERGQSVDRAYRAKDFAGRPTASICSAGNHRGRQPTPKYYRRSAPNDA